MGFYSCTWPVCGFQGIQDYLQRRGNCQVVWLLGIMLAGIRQTVDLNENCHPYCSMHTEILNWQNCLLSDADKCLQAPSADFCSVLYIIGLYGISFLMNDKTMFVRKFCYCKKLLCISCYKCVIFVRN